MARTGVMISQTSREGHHRPSHVHSNRTYAGASCTFRREGPRPQHSDKNARATTHFSPQPNVRATEHCHKLEERVTELPGRRQIPFCKEQRFEILKLQIRPE